MAAAAPPSEEECPVCHDDFTDPKILPCTHLVCRKCVLTWLHKGGNQAGCPLCRASILPQGSSGQDVAALVDDLPTDIITKAAVESRRVLTEKHVCVCYGSTMATSFCMQCSIKFCPACVKIHNVIPATKEHKIEQIAALTVDKLALSYQSSCTVHPGRQVEQFCSSHQELICINCSTSTHRRCSDVEGIAGAAEARRQRLREQAKELEGRKDELQTQILQLDTAAADRLMKFKAMKDDVKTTFDKLRGILDKRCRDATAEIQKKEDEFLQDNKSQKSDLEKQRARSAALCSTVSRLASASDDPLLAMLVKLKSRLEDAELLCSPNHAVRGIVGATEFVDFFFDPQSSACLQELIAGYGQLRDLKQPPQRVSKYKSNPTPLAGFYARANVNESTKSAMLEDEIPNLKPCQFKILCMPAVLERFYRHYPGLQVSVDKERRTAKVAAPEDVMKKAFSDVLGFVISLGETKMSLTPGLLKMFEQEDTKEWIQENLIRKHGLLCHWEVSEKRIIISGHASDLDRIHQMFKEAFNEKTIELRPVDDWILESPVWESFLEKLKDSASPPQPVLLPQGDRLITVDTPSNISTTVLNLNEFLARAREIEEYRRFIFSAKYGS